VVVGTPSVRQSLTSVEDLIVDSPDGTHVRLGDVARVRIGPSPTVIKHEDVSRSLDVTADVRGRSTSEAAVAVREQLKKVAFPPEYNAKVIAAGDTGSGIGRWAFGFLALAVLSVLLLQALFGSWTVAAVVTATAALSLSGGLLGAWLDGRTLSLGSFAGLFVVGALALRSQIPAAWSLRSATPWLDPGTPLFATKATFALLLPFLALGGVPGTEVVRPIAFVVLGGVLTTLLVTLFVLPALCARLPQMLPEGDADARM
jgi:Cu/Ag efflux pump CusA